MQKIQNLGKNGVGVGEGKKTPSLPKNGGEKYIIAEQRNRRLEIPINLKARTILLNRGSLFILSCLSWMSWCMCRKTESGGGGGEVEGTRVVPFPELWGKMVGLGSWAHSGDATEMPQGFSRLGGTLQA